MQPRAHPIPSLVPSSQISVPTTFESGQINVQVVGGPIVQEKPDSKEHVFEHPSFETAFPSSQASAPTIRESPHTELQTEGNPIHVQPFSTAHALVHPSRLRLFESSHPSMYEGELVSLTPFPH